MPRPSQHVLDAFRAVGGVSELSGGMGRTWTAGGIVIKPSDLAVETEWRAGVIDALDDSPAFRLARPARSVDGGWVVDGWEAWHGVAGKEDHYRPDDAVLVGNAFHEAIADLDRPEFLDIRDDPWMHGDRVAWEEAPLAGSDLAMSVLGPLGRFRQPVDEPDQVVHGDLLGNVLYDTGQPPAIIDWSAYYRPASWAAAVVVIDAICWYDGGEDLARRWSHLPSWKQMLVRALIYRVVADDILAAPNGLRTKIAGYRRGLAVIERL